MQVTASVMTLEFSGHEENNVPTLSEKPEWMGHPGASSSGELHDSGTLIVWHSEGEL